ncbi:MAG: death domain-containing protein, partial [Proteobacteria bacterium]|nr:death domain-containing protein [Pseudomonadota bacterium]
MPRDATESKPWSIQSNSLFYHAALLPQSHELQESITATFQQSQIVLQAQARPEPPRLTTLLNELTNRISAKWEEIGISLRLESGLLEIIKEDNPKDCRACLRNVLKEWLKQIDPPPSWVAIIKAVKDAGYR